jgi:predicted Zn-dependent protease
MGFMFPYPKDWTMNNMASEVTFSSKDGDGLLVFTMSEEEEMKAASQAFAQANNVQVMSDRAITVNGMACIKTFGNIIHENGIIGVLSYYVRMDDRIYMFHGFSISKLMNQYDRDFDAAVNGFRKIDPGTELVETPTRIEVRRVAGATTVRKAFNDFGIEEDKTDKLALVNSLMLDDILPKGSGIKIVPEP